MKDYEAIVKADWQKFDDEYRRYLKTELTSSTGLRNNDGGIMAVSDIDPESADKHVKELEELNFELGLPPPRQLTKEEVLQHITDKLMSKDLDSEWVYSEVKAIMKHSLPETIRKISNAMCPPEFGQSMSYGYAAMKHERANAMLKTLRKVVKDFTAHIMSLPNSCPEIIRQPFVAGLETAKSYIHLLEEELLHSRYKSDLGEYKDQTSHPAWNTIIVNVVDIVKREAETNYRYGERKAFSLTAQLFQAVYPWPWGNIPNGVATRRIRDRYDSIISK